MLLFQLGSRYVATEDRQQRAYRAGATVLLEPRRDISVSEIADVDWKLNGTQSVYSEQPVHTGIVFEKEEEKKEWREMQEITVTYAEVKMGSGDDQRHLPPSSSVVIRH
ncbi:hypothetical protein AOLI_G00211090 [Acnodon oligacanthus]